MNDDAPIMHKTYSGSSHVFRYQALADASKTNCDR